MKISSAEAAIEAAEFAVEIHEMPRLVRLIARRLPADPEDRGRSPGSKLLPIAPDLLTAERSRA
jgi:hypothetical protein